MFAVRLSKDCCLHSLLYKMLQHSCVFLLVIVWMSLSSGSAIQFGKGCLFCNNYVYMQYNRFLSTSRIISAECF